MATVVSLSKVVDASNQKLNGEGLWTILKSRCPQLYAATLATSNVDERMLPIGWKFEYLSDATTGADAGLQAVSPNGTRYDLEPCGIATAEREGGLWSWAVVAGAVLLAWYFTRKR
jgi:hypothetical protein